MAIDVVRDVIGFALANTVIVGSQRSSCFLKYGSDCAVLPFPTRRILDTKYVRARIISSAETSSSERSSVSAKLNLDTSKRSELRLYNSLTKSKEKFTTLNPGVVNFYSCGPTVYDFAHIGNFRAFLAYDVIKRWLLQQGYEVRHVMNLTDVDDKIIARTHKLGCSLKELTDKYTEAFFTDLQLLNVLPADHYPRATEHIQDIEDIVVALRDKDMAYERDGSTYFSVGAFPRYGQLVELDGRSGLDNGIDANADEYEKRDARDFALWKAWKADDGDVCWESEQLGKGRPGWHIECSCMAMKLLGPRLDIHGGGIDLAFPHHENEMAQSEAYSGVPFSTFWLHNGFVNIDNEKMSKSLGNFRTLRDIVSKRIDARAFRYLVVTSQYRSALAFTENCLDAARSAVRRLDILRDRLKLACDAGIESSNDDGVLTISDRAHREFVVSMDDDLNTPRAAAAMFSLVNAAEKMLKREELSSIGADIFLTCLGKFDAVFGIDYVPDFEEEDTSGKVIPVEVTEMLKQRNEARSVKNYQLADQIRDLISAAGYSIVDTPNGAVLEAKK